MFVLFVWCQCLKWQLFVTQENKPQSPSQTRKAREANTDSSKDGMAYNCLLKNELLGTGVDDLKALVSEI